MSEREGSQRERGSGPRRKREAISLGPATTAVRPEGRGPDSREERAVRERAGAQREPGATRPGRTAVGSAGQAEEQVRRRTVDDLLAEARGGMSRPGPAEAVAAQRRGALLVDIRPHAVRAADGEIPGALVVERNVLEWRFDPASRWRHPLTGYDAEVVVVCSEGYTSSLAAYALRQLGLHRATDLAGGFRAWQDAGLPVVPGGSAALP